MKYIILKSHSFDNCNSCPVNMICSGNTKEKFVNGSEGQSLDEIFDLIDQCESSDCLGIKLVEKDYKIGDLYKPFDNSFCINLETKEDSLILQQDIDFPCDCYVGPNPEEDGASFVAISDPYKFQVKFLGDFVTKDFINVKSTLTGNTYRTLYKPRY